MTATYDGSLSTDRDRIRLWLGDTNLASTLFSDEEIAGQLALYPDSPLLAAASLAESAAAKFSRSVSFAVEGLRIDNSQKSENYRKLAALLRSRAFSADLDAEGNLPVAGPVVPGTSLSDMDSVSANSDRPRSSFGIGMMDNPGLTEADEVQ